MDDRSISVDEDSLSQNLGVDTGNDDDELFMSAYEVQWR